MTQTCEAKQTLFLRERTNTLARATRVYRHAFLASVLQTEKPVKILHSSFWSVNMAAAKAVLAGTCVRCVRCVREAP